MSPLSRARIAEAAPGFEVEAVQETGSTNTDLLQRVRRAQPTRPLLRAALRQTAGRGRHGRRWFAGAGEALLFSLAVPMKADGARIAAATLAAGIGAAERLRQAGAPVSLKWPNDLVLDGRKLGGVLCELALDDEGRRSLEVGMGVNLRLEAATRDSIGQPAAALDQAMAPVACRESLIAGVATAVLDALRLYGQATRYTMFSGGLSRDELKRIQDPEIPLRQRWALLRPWVKLIQDTSFYRAHAASRLVRVATTQFYTTIDLTGFVGFNALTLAKGTDKLANFLFSGQSFSYGLAPGLRMPGFEGGRLRGELGAQRAEYDAAVELYNDTLLEAMREVADSLSAWQTTNEIMASHKRLVASLGDDCRLAKVRLVNGLDDDREVLRHRYPVLEQEYALRALESDQLVAAVDLIESLGGGYHNPDIEKRPKHNPS